MTAALRWDWEDVGNPFRVIGPGGEVLAEVWDPWDILDIVETILTTPEATQEVLRGLLGPSF